MTEDLSSPSPYPYLEISGENLEHNLDLMRAIAPGSKVLIPVKANAYGFDLETIMPFFMEMREKGKIDSLGVANPHEGKLVRELGWQGEVLMLGGFFLKNINCFFDHAITPAITDLWQAGALEQAASEREKTISVHLKIDTGMGRIGLLPGQIPELLAQLEESKHIKVSGIFTHFPRPDEPDDPVTSRQITSLKEISHTILNSLGISRDEVLLHAANSYGVMLHKESHLDLIRPGILFYGYFQSYADRQLYQKQYPFRPGLRLLARPVSLRTLQKGQTVSYGSIFTVPENNFPVGVFPLGYGDGIPRGLSGENFSFGKYPLLGRVTMDQIVLGEITSDEQIELIGSESASAEEIGDLTKSFSYEVITGLGNRLRRRLN